MRSLLVFALLALACSNDEETGPAATSASAGGAGPGATASSSVGQGAGGSSNPNERRVFVTSEMYAGDLGGIAGADQKCQTLAAALGGAWKAWVGDGVSSPSTNFTQSAVPYVLVGGGTVANDWADLTDGMLAVPIDHDEIGTAVDPNGNTHVWSGASPFGDLLPFHCEAWTSTLPDFTPRGLLTATDSYWVQSGPDPCATENHLYCFEQ